MSNLTQLRISGREIFDQALRSVSAGDAVKRTTTLTGSTLKITGFNIELASKKVYAIAIGKAANSMAAALDDIFGDWLSGGVITGIPTPGVSLPSKWRFFQGGHPEPNEESIAAAHAGFGLLDRANAEGALILFLISGGGSAMIESPITEDITLEDLRAANHALVNCGASIKEINSVRRAFSAIKGGRLADRAPQCDQITVIVSDVPQGHEEDVASGPTLPPGEASSAVDVINRYHLRSKIPKAILRTIDAKSNTAKSLSRDANSLRRHFVILDNMSALQAAAEAAQARGFEVEIVTGIADQPIEEGCLELAQKFSDLRERARRLNRPMVMLSGGEFACPVRGDGIGGRSLETALRLSSLINDSGSEPWVGLFAGTDGIDGNSPAAGAIIDSTTVRRARGIALDPEIFLKTSNAYSFFIALGDAIATGPTGTNVRDLRILLCAP